MKKPILTVAIILVTHIAFSQNPYVKKGSIGNVKQKPAVKDDDAYSISRLKSRKITDEIGKNFILIPPLHGREKYAYFRLKKGNTPSSESSTDVTFEEVNGKILRLDSITRFLYANESNEYGIFSDEKGKNYIQKLDHDCFGDFVPVSELDNARRWFLNKTLWLNKDIINTYDDEKDTYGKITNLRLEPVKVTDIVVSNKDNAPLRFILQTTKGETGYLDVAIEAVNSNPFPEDLFFNFFIVEDPKEGKTYSPALWALIKKGGAKLGMSREALILSKGYPDTINKTKGSYGVHEQYVYGYSYYYFENGKLTTIQN